MDMIRYEKEYAIAVYETGIDGRLNPHSLFNFLQDIASEHAVKLRFGKDDLMKENRFWVLSRIAAHVTLWPGWEEILVVRTWPRGTDKLFAIRDYSVSYPDGRHVASASSSWLVLDRTSRRVQRPDSLLTRFNADLTQESALGRNAVKLDPISSNSVKSSSFRVRMSDLDINLHTNNATYIMWITDTYSPEFRMTHVPSSIEVNYLAESKWNEEITVNSADDKTAALVFDHSVVRTADSTELCRVRIKWKDCRL